MVSTARTPCIVRSTVSGSMPWRSAQRVQIRLVAAMLSTSVPSMSKRKAAKVRSVNMAGSGRYPGSRVTRVLLAATAHPKRPANWHNLPGLPCLSSMIRPGIGCPVDARKPCGFVQARGKDAQLIPHKDELTICFAHVAYQLQAQFERRKTGIASFQAWDREQLEQRIGTADVLVISGLWRNELLDSANRLRFIQSIGAGTDQFSR